MPIFNFNKYIIDHLSCCINNSLLLYNNINILHTFFLLLFLFTGVANGLGQCETLGPDSCLTAYPDCIVVPIRACCYGVGSVCVSSTYTSIIDSGDLVPSATPMCLKNIVTNQVYQLDYEISQLPGYEITAPSKANCTTMNCEALGLVCITSLTACVQEELECCRPLPTCIQSSSQGNILDQYRWQTSRGVCDLPCQTGLVCKSIRGVPQCVPKTCKDLECDAQSECIEMVELGMASCFLKIDKTDVIPSCSKTIPCPTGFSCQKGEFTDFDCVPITKDLFQEEYNCSVCPEGFVCDQFGWGIMCTEWSYSDIPPLSCFGDSCLHAQFCNNVTQRCEFHRCSDDPNLCASDMICVQFDVTQPRVCASKSVIPYTDTPLWLQKFPFLNNRDTFSSN